MSKAVLFATLLNACPTAALQLSRGDLVRRAACAAGAICITAPRSASAKKFMEGGFKDLYKTDQEVISGGGSYAENAALPVFDADGSLVDGNGYSDTVTKRTVRQGKASVKVLKAWVPSNGNGLADPVTGSTANALTFTTAPSSLDSITDAGRPENLKLVGVLSLEEELVRADMVAAAKRTSDGVVYYEFDLALPAKTCTAELATACLPSLVVLLSACVRDGRLHVVRVDATPEQWRRSGTALKELRSTFTVDAASDATGDPA